MNNATTSTNKRFNNVFKVYKPNPRDQSKGCATSWEFSYNSNCVFLVIAKQNMNKDGNGNFTFDWDNKETMKLSITDLSKICTVLSGRQERIGEVDAKDQMKKGTGLFHKTNNGFSTLKVFKYNKGNISGSAIEFSSKKNDKSFWGGHLLSPDEEFALYQILKTCIARIFFNTNS